MRKIPKKIHYCWFGGNPLPDLDKNCIETWKKFCPDYEIIRWDESNYDITKNKYMMQAYEKKKWGFVPDFARLDIIYNEGGIYLDTDVELVKSLDELLKYEAYMGFEEGTYINPGLGFGAIKEQKEIKKLLSIYDNLEFINENGSINEIPSPIMNTNFLVSQGAIMNNTIQEINGMTLLPKDYLAPLSYDTGKLELTENTYSIHLYNMSWMENNKKKWIKRKQKLASKIGIEFANLVIKIISIPDRIINKIKGNFK